MTSDSDSWHSLLARAVPQVSAEAGLAALEQHCQECPLTSVLLVWERIVSVVELNSRQGISSAPQLLWKAQRLFERAAGTRYTFSLSSAVVQALVVIYCWRTIPWSSGLPLECWAQSGVMRTLLGEQPTLLPDKRRQRLVLCCSQEPVVLNAEAAQDLNQVHHAMPMAKFLLWDLHGTSTLARVYADHRDMWTTIGDWLLIPNPRMKCLPKAEDLPDMLERGFVYTAWWVHPDLQARPWFNRDLPSQELEHPDEPAVHDQASHYRCCLLYTSDAADEEDSVDLGGRRIIQKKKKTKARNKRSTNREHTHTQIEG
eukprot:TRINITY_DN45564_c0_g1_i1.p1 TRINITY_DN45564_c0_g1~~TRINITY_DN45564_c0_g1_i1.p1  ORF type:complete len:314 (-),score=71.16 TRINITY_DN45564_c0_g1_i1:21-962(-)